MRSLRGVVERCSYLRGYPVVHYFRRMVHEGLKGAAGKLPLPQPQCCLLHLGKHLVNFSQTNFVELQVHAPSTRERHSKVPLVRALILHVRRHH